MEYKTKKGEVVEIEETDVIKAVKEEYEKALKQKDDEIKIIKEKSEKEKEELRQEHVKQMRAILTGRKNEVKDNEFEEDEIDEEEEMLKQAKEYLSKM